MARPKKHDLEKRDQRLNLRLTLAEVEHLRDQAEAAGLPLSEYARRRVVGHVVVPAPQRVDAALVSEINRVGVNVNQLARAIHIDPVKPRFSSDWRVVLGELRQVLAKVASAYGA